MTKLEIIEALKAIPSYDFYEDEHGQTNMLEFSSDGRFIFKENIQAIISLAEDKVNA